MLSLILMADLVTVSTMSQFLSSHLDETVIFGTCMNIKVHGGLLGVTFLGYWKGLKSVDKLKRRCR